MTARKALRAYAHMLIECYGDNSYGMLLCSYALGELCFELAPSGNFSPAGQIGNPQD